MEMAAPPLWLTLLRGVHDAALLSLLGALAFRLLVLPRDLAGRMTLPLSRIILAGGGLALVSGFTWFLAEASVVADAHGIVATLKAVPAFVSYLGFARVLIARLVLIVAALTLSAWRFTALMLAAIAVAVQPWLGHAAQVGWALTASEILHLVAAAIWAGELIPLLLCLRFLPAHEAVLVFRRFTRPGFAAVVVLAVTGLAQGFVLAGGVSGLAGTAYGRVALLKASLFTLALLFATLNRFVLTGRLVQTGTGVRALGLSAGTEAALGIGIVLAAGWLASLPPA